jgi:hypothetical protein
MTDFRRQRTDQCQRAAADADSDVKFDCAGSADLPTITRASVPVNKCTSVPNTGYPMHCRADDGTMLVCARSRSTRPGGLNGRR